MQGQFDINDDYEHKDPVEYILENVLMADDGSPEFKLLQDDHNSQMTLSCSCKEPNNSCNNSVHCCHGGGYKYSNRKDELVLSQSADKGFPAIIECNDLCKCQMKQCMNRCVQFGPRKKLDIFYSPRYKSNGLRTTANIPLGAFICEYAGELLTLTEAKRRVESIDQNGLMNYVLCLHEHAESKEQITTIVDPAEHGNIGRYLNHSCQPNCEIIAVRINSPIPKIGIFAKHDIAANEELCFHYGGEDNHVGSIVGKPCLCAAPSCVGVIPNTRI